MKILKTTFFPLFKSCWPFIAIVLAVLIFFYPIFQNKVPLPGDFVLGIYSPWIDHIWPGYPVAVPVKNPILADVVSFTYPMQTLAISLMKSGEWPLWNQYIFGGTPLLANFQSAPFAITNIVYMFLGNVDGWTARILLQHILCVIFSYFLLRHWNLSKISSLGGGIFYAFSGFNIIWSQWNAHTLTAAFIPLIFLFEDKLLSKGNLSNGVFLALCVGLQIFSGYPQVVIYTFGAVGLLWLVNFTFQKSYFYKTFKLGTFLILGVLIASAQLFPARELLSLSQRSTEPHPYEWAFLPYSKVITFIAPDYFGNHTTGNWWGPQDYTSNTGFVGVIPSTLAVTGIGFSHKKKKFTVLLLTASLFLSFPTFISMLLWKSGLLGLQAASAHRALVLMNLSVSILGSFGIEAILKFKKIKVSNACIPLSVLVLFTTFAFSSSFKDHVSIALKNLVFPYFFSFICIILLLAFGLNHKKSKGIAIAFIIIGSIELFRFGWKFTPFIERSLVFPETPALRYLKEDSLTRTTGSHIIPINLRMNYGISSLEGYDAVYPETISKFLSAVNGGDPDTKLFSRYGFVNDDTSPLLDLANVGYVLAKREDSQIPKKYNTQKYTSIGIDEPKLVVLKNNSSLERLKMFYDWDVIQEEKILNVLSNRYPYKEKLLLSTSPAIKSNSKGEGSVDLIQYKSSTIKANVQTSRDGLLFLSDTFYPGWIALVDGTKVPILQADSVFRAIEIKKGSHEITYKYEPQSFFTGLKVSILIIALLLSFLILPLLKKKTSD